MQPLQNEKSILDWVPKERSKEEAKEKMKACLRLALTEKKQTEGRSYLSLEEYQALTVQKRKEKNPLFFFHESVAKKGKRPTMEDAHICLSHPKGLLVAVFDGHGGNAIALKLKSRFENQFFPLLEENQDDVYKTLQSLIFEISIEVYKKEGQHCGSTAVISFLSSNKRKIYTATVGDSEANIYRMIENRCRSIPLSRPLNWTHPKEATRAATVLQQPDLVEKWTRISDPKRVRYPWGASGLNVSRSLGDYQWNAAAKAQGVTSKPSITCCDLQEGDYVTLMCDGIKDFYPEDCIRDHIELFTDLREKNGMIQRIAHLALDIYQSTDNITGIGIQVSE